MLDTLLIRSLLVLLLGTGGAMAGDPFSEEFGRFDATLDASDPDLVAMTAAEVGSIEDGSLAQAMGLRVGDRLIGLDGLRVVGSSEWDLVRFRRPDQPDDLRMAVLRDGRVLELRSARTLPVRRLGFDFADAPAVCHAALAGIGYGVPAAGGGFPDPPPRVALALLRWSAHADPAAERGWIPALAALSEALVAGRWRDAAALPPVAVPASCPQLQRLTHFYAALAAYHAQGEQAPDPAHNGETLLYFVIHYPYPRLHLPALGAATHPDRRFIDALGELGLNPGRAERWQAAMEDMKQQEGEGDYAFRVRQAVLDQPNHGGWPFRHKEVYERGSRPGLLASLRSEATGGGPFADWSAFALIQATMVDAGDRHHKDPLGEVLPLVAPLRARSPLLGYLALNVLRSTSHYWDVFEVRERLRAAYLAGPLSAAEPPSRLLDYLRAHDAGFDLLALPATCSGLHEQLDLVHGALSRTLAFADLQQAVSAPTVAMLPVDQRQALLAQLLDYVHDGCEKSDLVAMARLALPGAMCDAVSEIALWHARGRADQVWLMAEGIPGLRLPLERAQVPRMRAALGAIPWEDAPAASAAVAQAHLVAGTPYATLLLAEACAAHGRGDLAGDLQRRVDRFFDRFDQLAELQDFNRKTRRWFAEIRMAVQGPWPRTCALALAAGDRLQGLTREGEDWDSVQLHQARAALVAGQVPAAVDWLCHSFASAKHDEQPVFLVADACIDDCRTYRTWLLRQLVAAAEFTPALRQRLVAAARGDQVDEAFAGLLAVPRASLKGAASAPGGNDF